MKYAIFSSVLFCACASNPKCGNPEGAKVVYSGSSSCSVRIRQVIVGSELKIPESLKGTNLNGHDLQWVDGQLKDGTIELGHFVLVPRPIGSSK